MNSPIKFKYTIVLLFLILLTTSIKTFAETWYVDKNASGNNSGTSWANAWQSFSAITGLSSGDIVYISGGTDSLVYFETLECTAGVTYQVGQDANHNGLVIIDAQRTRDHCILPATNVTISGEVNQSRRLLLRNTLESGIHSGSANGIKVTYVEITSCGASGAAGGFAHGIRFGGAQGCEVSYSYIHHNYQDGYNAGGSSGPLGSNKLHHNIIVHNSDDGIACRSGHDIYENIIGDMYAHPNGGAGHPDGIQAQGENNRIWNNEVYNCRTHGIFADPLNVGTASNIYIYNNVIYRTRSFADAGHHMAAMSVKAESGTHTLENVLVANNTIVDMGYKGLSVNAPNNNNVRVVNNLFYNCRMDGPTGHVCGSLDGTDGILIDNNLVNAGNSGGNVMVWGGDNISYSQFVANGYGQANGQTGAPNFISYTELGSNNDFRLSINDSSARNNGINLSDIFSIDKAGLPRPQGSNWDIGAFQTQTGIPSPPAGLRVVK